jgi:methylmalonyl-CoA mutase cobalamin-binding domain/chain
MADKTIKVLMAQFSLETHTRGLFTVAGMLRDAGMEVVLLGNALPSHIIDIAADEDADVIGISTYCGGELVLGKDLIDTAKEKGIFDSTVFVIGGIFPPEDEPELKKIGFDGVFPPGAVSSREEIVGLIKKAVSEKQGG